MFCKKYLFNSAFFFSKSTQTECGLMQLNKNKTHADRPRAGEPGENPPERDVIMTERINPANAEFSAQADQKTRPPCTQ